MAANKSILTPLKLGIHQSGDGGREGGEDEGSRDEGGVGSHGSRVGGGNGAGVT